MQNSTLLRQYQPTSTARYNRRRFLRQASAAVSATAFVLPAARADSPNDRVNLAAVGVGGKGWSDINGAAPGNNVVAFCDVESTVRSRGIRGSEGLQYMRLSGDDCRNACSCDVRRSDHPRMIGRSIIHTTSAGPECRVTRLPSKPFVYTRE